MGVCDRVDFDDIKITGKWNGEHAVVSYVNDISWSSALAAAGMPHVGQKMYLMKRDRVNRQLYLDLLDMVFPGVRARLALITRVKPLCHLIHQNVVTASQWDLWA
jgi:hypothetical protein